MYISAGSGTHKFVHQKWRDQIFPMVNFVVFSQWSLWFGGREGGGLVQGVWGGGTGLLLRLSAVLLQGWAKAQVQAMGCPFCV